MRRCLNKPAFNAESISLNSYKSIIIRFNLNLQTTKLTKTTHSISYQQKSHSEVKVLKKNMIWVIRE